MISPRIRLCLGMIVFAVAAFATASSAQAVTYLQLGTSNTSNATTTLAGSASGAELKVVDTNGTASTAGVLGLLTATAPTVNSAALRGQNNATNAFGYGVYGSQAGRGIGVSGFAPTGTGVRGQSTSGIGVVGQHTAATGTAPGVFASTNSTHADVPGPELGSSAWHQQRDRFERDRRLWATERVGLRRLWLQPRRKSRLRHQHERKRPVRAEPDRS